MTKRCYQVLGPYYFGRAYEHPPHFTWSLVAPPEAGVPECSKPVALIPCVDQVRVRSTNVLKDPGFELQTATYGTGPNLADDIPHYTTQTGFGTVPFRWVDPSDGNSTNDPEAGRATYWVQDFTQSTSIRWQTSTANPRSGSRHARKTMATSSPTGSGSSYSLYADQWTRCAAPAVAGANFYTAAVRGGDTVTFSFYMMVNSTAASPTVNRVIDFYDGQFEFTTGYTEVGPTNLTTSYAQYSVTKIVPNNNTKYATCYLWVSHDNAAPTIVDMDDAVVSVTSINP